MSIIEEARRNTAEWAEWGEAASDDHFYGAWKGGSAKAGGHPEGGSATMSREQRHRLVGVAAAAARPFPSAPRRRQVVDARIANIDSSLPKGRAVRVGATPVTQFDLPKEVTPKARHVVDEPVAGIQQWYDRYTRSWVAHYVDKAGNQVGDSTYDGRRVDSDRSVRSLWLGAHEVREAKDSEDHFYGAWRGGSKASGGGPVRSGGAPKAKPKPAPRPAVLHGKPEEAKEALERASKARAGFAWTGYSPTSMRMMAKAENAEFGPPGGVKVIDVSGTSTNFWFYDRDGMAAGNVEVRGDKVSQVTIRADLRGKGYGTRMYDAIQDGGHANLYDVIGRSNEFTDDGKRFAMSWLQHRVKVEEERAGRPVPGQLPLGFAEADDEDHFYGAWRGGSAKAGGHPMTPKEKMVGAKARKENALLANVKRHSARVSRMRGHGSWSGFAFQPIAEAPTGKPNTGRFTSQGDFGGSFSYFGKDGKQAGVVSFSKRGGEWKVLGVTVRQGYRGQGIGKSMYDYLQDHTEVNMYGAIGAFNTFSRDGKQFASHWLKGRIKLETVRAGLGPKPRVRRSRAVAAAVAEAAADEDHFYGAWRGGSKASGGGPVSKAKAAEPGPGGVKAAVERTGVELAMGTQDYETGVLLDGDGRVIYRQKGTGGDHAKGIAGAVDLSREQMVQMKDAHFVHNHPSGTGLSLPDINVAVTYDAASIHAYGTDASGRRTHYSLTRPAHGWLPELQVLTGVQKPGDRMTATQFSAFSDVMDGAHRAVMVENTAKLIRARSGSPGDYAAAAAEANRTHYRDVGKRVADWFGAEYRDETWEAP